MSASLVGSEMCIRDSHKGARPPETALHCVPLFLAMVGISGCAGGSFWPVSYTHLTLPTICSV
eukprot:3562245-Alexandrium_andersonii.AAC.1